MHWYDTLANCSSCANSEAEEKKELEEQRKYFLEKKKRAIEKELGTDIEESDKLIEEYNSRIKERHIPEDVMGVIKEEMVHGRLV